MDAAYQRTHRELRLKRGHAAIGGPCADCGGGADQWSHRHGTDTSDIQNYDRRCYSCHVKYDRRKPRSGWSEQDIEIMRELRRDFTVREIAELFGVSRQLVSKLTRGPHPGG